MLLNIMKAFLLFYFFKEVAEFCIVMYLQD